LEFGGVLNLSSGGTSLMTTALHGSEERVAGIAISTVVDSGGMLNVSGGTAIGAHVLAGSAIVQALGVALGIGVGGTLKLSAGGTAIDADFDEGLEQIFSGGTDIRGSIFEASQTIFAGGESDDAVLAIAAQTVSSGGFALRTVLKTIGEEFVLAGGTSLQTSVLDR
jgi:autotransporter passenger strand-loop-strand repeat protein